MNRSIVFMTVALLVGCSDDENTRSAEPMDASQLDEDMSSEEQPEPDEFEGILFKSSCDEIECFKDGQLPDSSELIFRGDDSSSFADLIFCDFSCVQVDGEYKTVSRTWWKGGVSGKACWEVRSMSTSESSDQADCGDM